MDILTHNLVWACGSIILLNIITIIIFDCIIICKKLIDFKIDGHDKKITVFTTRCDTLYGVTYCVLAPEHKYVDEITTSQHKEEVEKYKASLEKNKTRFQVVEETEQPDGAILVRVRKQYNDKTDVAEYFN